MITLRPYQKEPIQKAIDFFSQPNNEPSLIVLPTAWGKSILTAFVAKSIPENDRLLVIQPSKELLEQNYSKYVALCGEEASAGIYSASFGKKQVERITYATIGSIKEIGKQFKELGFTKMLIDEAHLYPRKEESMLGQFLRDSGITQVLGITATPLKLESFTEKQGEKFDKWSELIMLTNPSPSGSFFKSILHVGQIQEMTSMKFWSPLRYEIIPFDKSMLRLNSTGSEYTDDSNVNAYILNNIRANIFGALDYHRECQHCLVFVPTVEEACILANEYPNSAVVSGDMAKKDRAYIIDAYRNGRIRVLFNVSVLGTGFDYTKIDMIIFGMSTASVARYYQFCGRGVRIDPEKRDCLIVDMGGNIERFGHVEDIYFEWNGRWRMYGTKDRLLTGIPIDIVGTFDRQDIYRMYNWPNFVQFLNNGKHKGTPIDDVPLSYLRWMMKNCLNNTDLQVLDRIRLRIENRIRDTRNEPPMMLMPNGTHAGEHIAMVPRGYLSWYYHSTDWNETNDSLRRGIEEAFGCVPPKINKKPTSKKK